MKSAFFSLLFAGILILGFQTKTSASHYAGGSITYDYIGDSTGVPFNYCIKLVLYRRQQGATILPNQNIQINSSCFGSSSINLSYAAGFTPGATPNGDTNCIDQSDPGYASSKLEEYVYSTCITLPGKCSDYTFSWANCCRNANISNLVNPGSQPLYLEAGLNNFFGPNNSPEFLNPGAKFFCVGQNFTWSQAASEPDFDSILYSLANPLSGANTNIPYTPGYSVLQPMTTQNGFNLNPATGVFNFTPSQPEVVVIKVLVKEYRLDTNTNLQYLAGYVGRDVQIPVLNSCNRLASSGVSISQGQVSGNITSGSSVLDGDSLINQFGVDSVADFGGGNLNIDYIGYDCYSSEVNIKVDGNLKCSSIASDGTDFRIIGPDSIARPIAEVKINCQTTLLTDEIQLVLHRPLDVNGDYLLQVKKGSDGNTIENECGYGVKEFFSLIIRVGNCTELSYELENVSVENDEQIRIDWMVDTSTLVPQHGQLFTGWNIYRATYPSGPFYLLDTLENPNDFNRRSYVDSTLSMVNLDQSSYRYRVQLVQNYNFRKPTREIESILLQHTVNSDSTGYALQWNEYTAWPAPEYELFTAAVDTASPSLNWQSIDGPSSTLLASNFLKPAPLTAANAGFRVFKVEASNPQNANNPFVSESNWIYIELKLDPDLPTELPDSAIIPNVFSPNGDAINDFFYINGVEGYTSASMVVYNRWGRKVFSRSEEKARANQQALYWDGRDGTSSELLADGVYYYVVNLHDDATGVVTNYQGQVNILKN